MDSFLQPPRTAAGGTDAPPHVEHMTVQANGQRFYAAAAGPVDGPLVMLLHGFPEISYGWRHQLGALAAAGFRAVAPDQRGYGLSDKPRGIAAYATDVLADDAIGIAGCFGRDRFSVVGHDWGGIVAWYLAARKSAAVRRVAILNAPHPSTLADHVLYSATQAFKSAYIALFQLPWVSEKLLGLRDHAVLVKALTATSRPGTFSPEEIAVYRRAWAQEGALTGMLNWYRAMWLGPSLASHRIVVPLRLLWGDRDAALNADLADDALTHCDRAEVLHFPQATHWLHHEQADDVNALLIDFLKTPGRQEH